ncbi:hypothetical protein K435DRAFT_869098 [Dendrothele bispora CBS 962.96]|uniref:Uncharacterized protein n=1 Tax=Dendrothele bispora (strain CBS 962.96) TaxID=1314807 RepID=A0A4S8LA63_DENBC|nr:hypothetical protein K435DRAFT_869098 [Dendrothele bispora CBS 962.96]
MTGDGKQNELFDFKNVHQQNQSIINSSSCSYLSDLWLFTSDYCYLCHFGLPGCSLFELDQSDTFHLLLLTELLHASPSSSSAGLKRSRGTSAAVIVLQAVHIHWQKLELEFLQS